MKLQINSTEKIIRLEEQVNLGELFTFLEEILPDLKWREYSIEGNVGVYVGESGIHLVNPVYLTTPTYTTAVPANPYITYCTSSTGETK